MLSAVSGLREIGQNLSPFKSSSGDFAAKKNCLHTHLYAPQTDSGNRRMQQLSCIQAYHGTFLIFLLSSDLIAEGSTIKNPAAKTSRRCAL